MKPRERVIRALDHQETDRVPVDFGGTVVTCLELGANRRLKAHLGITDGDDPIIDYTMGTVEPCDRLKAMSGSDCRRVALNYGSPNIVAGCWTNGFGITMKKAEPHEYFDVICNPLREAAIDDLDRMQMPDPDVAGIYAGLKERAKDLHDNSPYAIIADFGVPGFYETAQKLRGYEQFACDLLIGKEFVRVLFERLLGLQKRFFRNYLAQVGKYVHAIGYADDLGMQDRPQISPETYRTMLKPWHREIFAFIHGHTDAKIILHSCGAIFPLVDDLIDAGIDVLNPVQTSAKGMEPERLKEAFGGRVAFWGGFDVQHMLPRGSGAEIEAETQRLMRVLGEGGGYVFAPAHNIQADTPPENIVHLFDAAARHGMRS